jgi:protein phosphatase 1L
MEDEFFYSQDGEFAAVFDGHGGQAVSRYLKKNLYANVQAFLPATTTTSSGTTTEPTTDHEQPLKRASASVQDYENAIISALDKVDREVQRISHWSYQGSTAVAIWLHEERKILAENESPSILKTIIAANVGDSRAVLCRNNTAYDLTRDHKPDDPLEQARIEALGGEVVWCGDRDKVGDPILERGIYRVNGNLALSRAIGDRSERPHVTAEPEIISATIVDGDDFIIVATDGLWDVFDSDDAVHYVLSLRTDGHQLERIATFVVEEALRRGTYDNITVVIIWLDRKKSN